MAAAAPEGDLDCPNNLYPKSNPLLDSQYPGRYNFHTGMNETSDDMANATVLIALSGNVTSLVAANTFRNGTLLLPLLLATIATAADTAC